MGERARENNEVGYASKGIMCIVVINPDFQVDRNWSQETYFWADL